MNGLNFNKKRLTLLFLDLGFLSLKLSLKLLLFLSLYLGYPLSFNLFNICLRCIKQLNDGFFGKLNILALHLHGLNLPDVFLYRLHLVLNLLLLQYLLDCLFELLELLIVGVYRLYLVQVVDNGQHSVFELYVLSTDLGFFQL